MVADSPTANLRLRLQGAGNNNNTWGDLENTVVSLIEDALTGLTTISVPATGDYTLSTANYVSDEARRAFLKANGSPTGNFRVVAPAVPKSYWVWNNTAKVQTTASQGGGGSATTDAGDIEPVWTDGTNVKQITFGGLRLKDFIAASVLAATGTLPSYTGNAGKYIYTDGSSAFWRQPLTTDLGDYLTKVLGVQVALAVAL